jgi:hypothetical protein
MHGWAAVDFIASDLTDIIEKKFKAWAVSTSTLYLMYKKNCCLYCARTILYMQLRRPFKSTLHSTLIGYTAPFTPFFVEKKN